MQKILIRGIGETESDFYFVSEELPAIFKLDKETQYVSIECDMSDKFTENTFSYNYVIRVNGYLFLVPIYSDNGIIKYNLDEKTYDFIFVGVKDILDTYVINENYLYLIDRENIVRINVDSNEVVIIDKWYQELKSYITNKEEKLIGQPYIIDRKMILVCCQADVVIELDIDTQEVKKINLDATNKGYHNTCYANGKFFSITNKGDKILCITNQYDIVDIYEITPIEKINNAEPAFREILSCGRCLILIPWRSKGILSYNIDTREQKLLYKVNCDDWACTYSDEIDGRIRIVIQEKNRSVIMIVSENGKEEYTLNYTPQIIRKIEDICPRHVFYEKTLNCKTYLESLVI